MTDADLSFSFESTADTGVASTIFATRVCDSHQDSSAAHGLMCPICSGPTRGFNEHNLSLCPTCGHIFQTDMKVTAVYDAAYAHKHDKYPVTEISNVRWDFIQSHLKLAPHSRVLDVGYGNGAFLKRARLAGMKIYGIDVHNEDFGVPVVDFDHPEEYEIISFFDSLEHFPDFNSIFRLKSRNIIVSLPRTPSFLLDNPSIWRHYRPGEHMHYFSTDSLDRFMRDLGFPVKLADGFPEDAVRGKLLLNGHPADNIYTAIYTRET